MNFRSVVRKLAKPGIERASLARYGIERDLRSHRT